MNASIQTLEPRVLFALVPAITPTAPEQEMLTLLNRMRTDPAHELNLLIHSNDQDVNNAIDFFNVDLKVLAQQWAQLLPAPPLAWNDILAGTAQAHSQAMLDADEQAHQVPGEPDLSTRIVKAGYDFATAGENVYAFGDSIFESHAAFAIDWGDDTSGIQNPPGHRDNIMDAGFREVGIGLVSAPKNKKTGPLLVTQDLGTRRHPGDPLLVGTVYNDLNADGFYNAGEGISGATITLTGSAGTFSTTSLAAGGYQVKADPGTYKVTATGAALGGTVTLGNVAIGTDNVLRDFRPDMVTFGTISGGVLSIQGTDAADTIKLTQSAGKTSVRRNGTLETFSSSQISQINIFAGDGNDTIDFSTVGLATYVNAGAGNDNVLGGSGKDTITGAAGKDTILGGDGDDRLNGMGTADQLYGQAGNDRLYGGDANDTLDGGGGIDRLFGEDGNDSLLGGGSNDKLYGENGNDTLNGQGQADILNGGAGSDTATKDMLDSVVEVETVLT